MKNEEVLILQFSPWYNSTDLSYGKKATAKYILLVIISPPKFTNNTFCFIHSNLTANDFSPYVFNRVNIVKAGLIFIAYFLTKSLQVFHFNLHPPKCLILYRSAVYISKNPLFVCPKATECEATERLQKSSQTLHNQGIRYKVKFSWGN